MRNPARGGASVSLASDCGNPTPEPSKSQRSAGKFRAQAKWQSANPKATWAHAALRSGLKRGLLERRPCEVCGDEPADGHHDDYSRPLDVRWLCRKHHKALHRQARRS